MSSFLVLSRRHELLPFAHRLTTEGHTVESLVSVGIFEGAWGGKINKVLRDSKGQINPENLGPIVKLAEQGELTVLINDWRLQSTVFQNSARLFGTLRHPELPECTDHIRIGGWFNGENLTAIHLLIVDIGAWINGHGPQIDSALTLIRNEKDSVTTLINDLVSPHLDFLKSKSFKGLVQFGIEFDTPSNDPEIVSLTAGFSPLHAHAFLSELDSFGKVLLGQQEAVLSSRFVTVVPLTIPPYPNTRARLSRQQVPIEGLTEKQISRVFWHDFQVDLESRQISTAGLDGFVGVARGAAESLVLSRGLALEIPQKVSLHQKQYREDVGLRVENALAVLERNFGLVLF